jgi:isoquinoline 1-oxidoreductase alpha subunit
LPAEPSATLFARCFREMIVIELTINGAKTRLDIDPDMPLLWALRDHAGLTGTKYGCGIAQCGACTVHVDGQPVRSCSMPVSAVVGQSITTIEAASGKVASAVQAAWTALDVPQCGYCQSGQVMATIALLEANKAPTDSDIDAALAGHICRCATYARIRSAVHVAARALA